LDLHKVATVRELDEPGAGVVLCAEEEGVHRALRIGVKTLGIAYAAHLGFFFFDNKIDISDNCGKKISI
jgi:hypothetical protein